MAAEEGHYTREDQGKVGSIHTVEEARAAHHLATADPEPERGDGTLTGTAHEEKYGLERAAASRAAWIGRGVHPTENRALLPGEEGHENLVGAPVAAPAEPVTTAENTRQSAPFENTAAPTA